MFSRARRLLLAILLLGSPTATETIIAQANTRVAISPTSALVGDGQTAAVEVRVENVQDLYGLDIRIGFDPAVVEVVDADTTQAGVQVRPGDLLSVDFLIRNTVDNAQGTIWYALTQLNPSEPVSGSGVAFVILFKGKQRGATSALTITYQKMATREGKAIPADSGNGEIRVVEPAQAPPTPTTAPPPPQPTVPMVTPPPEPTQAPTQALPAATVAAPTTPAPAYTAAPTATLAPTQTASSAPANTQPPTVATSGAQATAAPTPHVQPTPPPQPTPTTDGPVSEGKLDWALVLVGVGGVLLLFGAGWILRKRTRQAD